MSTLKYVADVDLMTVTLDSAYTAGSGSMALTAGHGARLPSAGDFWLRTTSGTYRCFKVTARSTDALTVTAAQDGTSDGNLDAGTELKWVLGATAFDQFRSDLVQSGPYASLPTGEKTGQLYIPTDSAYNFLRYNGAAWEHFRDGQLMVPPVLGDLTWNNQGGATAVTTYGGIFMTSTTGSDDLRSLVKSVTAPYTVTAAFILDAFSGNYNGAGIHLRQSSDDKMIEIRDSGAGEFGDTKWNNSTSWGGAYSISVNRRRYSPAVLWQRIVDNSTNRVTYSSPDGANWLQMNTVSRTDFCTPDQAGFGLFNNNGTNFPRAWLIHLKFE